MASVLNEVLSANRDYVASFDKGDLPLPSRQAFCHSDLYGCQAGSSQICRPV